MILSLFHVHMYTSIRFSYACIYIPSFLFFVHMHTSVFFFFFFLHMPTSAILCGHIYTNVFCVVCIRIPTSFSKCAYAMYQYCAYTNQCHLCVFCLHMNVSVVVVFLFTFVYQRPLLFRIFIHFRVFACIRTLFVVLCICRLTSCCRCITRVGVCFFFM